MHTCWPLNNYISRSILFLALTYCVFSFWRLLQTHSNTEPICLFYWICNLQALELILYFFSCLDFVIRIFYCLSIYIYLIYNIKPVLVIKDPFKNCSVLVNLACSTSHTVTVILFYECCVLHQHFCYSCSIITYKFYETESQRLFGFTIPPSSSHKTR